MKSNLSRLPLWMVVCGAMLAAPLAAADDPPGDLLTEDGVITGEMTIDFRTRTNPDTTGQLVEGSPAMGVQDRYAFTLSVARTVEFSGEIVRQPNLYSRNLRQLKQGAALGFNVDLAVYNPRDLKQKRTVGKWVGNVPIDTATGAYNLAGAKAPDRPLRIAIDSIGQARGFEDMFSGRIVGKTEKKDTLAGYTYKRLIGNRTVEVTVTKSDPMRFDAVTLAKGPSENYPRTVVTGRLDYDYETGNWFTDGIRFKYQVDGRDVEDVVTGTIKWVEDPARDTNGRGQYEFNLRFNEDSNRSTTDESAAFADMSEEDAFFAVDDAIPCLTGVIEYVDTMIPGEELPSMSKVTYRLNANKLTKQQVVNFAKLWLLAVGPTNDE